MCSDSRARTSSGSPCRASSSRARSVAILTGSSPLTRIPAGPGMDVAAIDLERMKRGDRVFDVGRVAGELQHAFMRDSGDRRRAEPFIRHFLWEYSCHFPDREQTFESITARAPYYMALNLLRIARNGYIGQDYGRRLVRHANRMLQAA